MEALTTRCDELNEELRKLKEELGELPGLKEKEVRCEELKSCLFQTEQWRERASKQLEISIGNLDKATGFSATLGHEVGELTEAHRKLVHQKQFLSKQVEEDLKTFKLLLDAAKIYKLRSERRARKARDWLTSDKPEATTFLDNLSHEMMETMQVP